MPEEGVVPLCHEDILTFDEIIRICRAGVELGIRRIKITGGEPLVRKGIFDLLEQMRRIEGAEKLTITTNGALLEEALPWLEAV